MATTHNPSAQEMLDGLVDHRYAFQRLSNALMTQGSYYSRGRDALPYAVMATTHVDGQEVQLTDGLTPVLDVLAKEAEERLELAYAKIAANAVIGDRSYSASEMEHLRKLLPMYISFLQKYIEVMKSAERTMETHLQQVRSAGSDMAKEALSSLGSAKGAGDAHAFVRSIQEGHSRDNQYTLETQPRGLERATQKLEEMEELLGQLDAAKTNANSVLVAPFPRPSPIPPIVGNEPTKTVQAVLCESTKGPASYYAKLSKL